MFPLLENKTYIKSFENWDFSEKKVLTTLKSSWKSYISLL